MSKLEQIEKTELEIIPDPDMYISLEKGTRVEFLIFLTDTTKSTINV